MPQKRYKEDIESWTDFEETVRDLQTEHNSTPTGIVFRGVDDAQYALQTTLEREDPVPISVQEYYDLTITAIKPAIETLTDVSWKVPDDKKRLSELAADHDGPWFPHFPSPGYYRYLVYLRHHGFPSPLLDWTESPYIAAFFAFRHAKPNTQRVAIYAYCEYPTRTKRILKGKPQIDVLGPYVRSHPRHFRQQSNYTMSLRYDESSNQWLFAPHEEMFGYHDRQDFLWKFTLPMTLRNAVLQLLDTYNLTAYSLFGSEESLMETMWFRERVLRGRE